MLLYGNEDDKHKKLHSIYLISRTKTMYKGDKESVKGCHYVLNCSF